MKNVKLYFLLLITIIGLGSCEKKTYTLSSTVSPSLSGIVTPAQGSYEEGEIVTLVAQPNNGWIFQKWEGDISGTTNSASLTMNSNKNVVAVFLRRDYPLNIMISGEGTVQEKIISSPSKSYPFETVVELTPVPKAGWMFDGWEGDLSGIVTPKNITIDKEKNITAKFVKIINLYGGNNLDYISDISPTNDGGYIITGTTNSNDGFFAGLTSYQNLDIFIAKLNSKGEKLWVKKIGGNKIDAAFRVIQTKDGGYILIGDSTSNDGDFVGLNKGFFDSFIMKFNSNGDKLWTTMIGGSKYDSAYSVVESNSGDYFIIGTSDSNDFDFNGLNKGVNDLFITKINNSGQKNWTKLYGGSSQDYGYDIINAHDDGLIILGDVTSTEGDFADINRIRNPFLLTKINFEGNIQWVSSINDDKMEKGNRIIQTKDGGYISVGYIYTSDIGYTTDYHSVRIVMDLLIRKFNSQGNLMWTKQFGGSKDDEGFSIIETKERDLIVVGITESNDRDLLDLNKGNMDVFAMKLNLNGEKIWTKVYGGTRNDEWPSIALTTDGKIIIAGNTSSSDKDFAEKTQGSTDFFIINLR